MPKVQKIAVLKADTRYSHMGGRSRPTGSDAIKWQKGSKQWSRGIINYFHGEMEQRKVLI